MDCVARKNGCVVMKIIRLFVIISLTILILVSCQRKASFQVEQSYNQYEKIREFLSSSDYTDNDNILYQYILNQLRSSDALVEELRFEGAGDSEEVEEGKNIICRFYPQHSRRILIVSPYSTVGMNNPQYYQAEVERIAFNNALLLEMANTLATQIPNQYGVDLVFLGSRKHDYITSAFKEAFKSLSDNYGKSKPEMGMFLWLHPTKEMSIPIDDHSYQKLPYIVHRVWTSAEYSGWREFAKSIEGSSLYEGEELLYKNLNTIKLKNGYEPEEEISKEDLINNFRMLGSVLSGIVYAKD